MGSQIGRLWLHVNDFQNSLPNLYTFDIDYRLSFNFRVTDSGMVWPYDECEFGILEEYHFSALCIGYGIYLQLKNGLNYLFI